MTATHNHKERHVNKTVIDERVHAAIRPVLDKADALLDHYLQDAPVEVWGPIARTLQ